MVVLQLAGCDLVAVTVGVPVGWVLVGPLELLVVAVVAQLLAGVVVSAGVVVVVVSVALVEARVGVAVSGAGPVAHSAVRGYWLWLASVVGVGLFEPETARVAEWVELG
mgnify:CR=1 FL=1